MLWLLSIDASMSDDYAYTYDVGNRSGVWLNGTRVVSQTHDAAGNLLGDGTNSYGYDALNRLLPRT